MSDWDEVGGEYCEIGEIRDGSKEGFYVMNEKVHSLPVSTYGG